MEMSIYIESVHFEKLPDVAYGKGSVSFYSTNEENVATVKFTFNTKLLELDGYLEISQDEYIKNAGNLKEIIKEKIIETLN